MEAKSIGLGFQFKNLWTQNLKKIRLIIFTRVK